MAAATALCLLACLPLQARAAAPAAVVAPLPTTPAPEAGERILVVAPHPDDETLCCAGFVQRALARGAQVSVVWITSGDAFELDAVVVERTLAPGHRAMRTLAATRMREALAATTRLGIASDQRWFLGYPDRGIRRLLTDFQVRPYRSPYTAATAVPYAEALAAGTAYEGRWLERDLRRIIERVQPTRVLAPSPLDLHPDHAAVGELVQRLMSARVASANVLYWIVHGGHRWPAPRRYAPTAQLQPPLHTRALDWSSWPLTPAERDTKLAALRLYRSQWEIMGPFMAAFARGNELFTADAAAR